MVEDIKYEVEELQFVLAGQNDPPRKTFSETLFLRVIFADIAVLLFGQKQADFYKIRAAASPFYVSAY